MILHRVKSEILDDCLRIQRVLFREGIDERLPTCRCLWEQISYFHHHTSWQPLPSTDEELFRMISETTDILD